MSTSNENQETYTVQDNDYPDPVMIRTEVLAKLRGESTISEAPSKSEEEVAIDFLLASIRKRDETLSKIEEILDKQSFDFDFDAPTVVDVELIHAVLMEYKGK